MPTALSTIWLARIASIVAILNPTQSGAAEQLLREHRGDTDPITEGWSFSGSTSTTALEPGDRDLGAHNCEDPCPFWRITDSGSRSGNFGVYAGGPVPSGDSRGWAARAWVRRPPLTEGQAEAPSFAASLYARIPVGGGKMQEYGVKFGVTADGTMQLQSVPASGSPVIVEMGPSFDYHRIDIVYDPERAKADVLVDGRVVLPDYGGRVLDGSSNLLSWGSGDSASTGRSHWHLVQLLAAPDTDGDGLADADERGTFSSDPYHGDSDDDGLADADEVVAGTDLLQRDSDGDGLEDGFEARRGLNPLVADDQHLDLEPDGLTNAEERDAGTDPWLTDTDSDGLGDGDEVRTHRSDPTRRDTDGDGLDDALEVSTLHTDPVLADSDLDGLTDAEELDTYHTDPTKADSDGDGLPDGNEVQGTFADDLSAPATPTDPNSGDSDGDGLADGFEVLHGFDPSQSNAADADSDGDGLTDGGEQTAGSDPRRADSDDDALSDGEEVTLRGTDPMRQDSDGDGLLDGFETARGLNPTRPDDPASDADADGLTLLREQAIGTDPRVADSDGDGRPDGDEANILGTDPRVPDAGQVPVLDLQVLRFEATDQPLFTDQPKPVRIPLDHFVPPEANATQTRGRVEEITLPIPLLAAQNAWDTAVATCDAVSYTYRVSDKIPACRNLTVSPTRTECINGGDIDLSTRSVTCCANVVSHIIDLTDHIANGCTENRIFGQPTLNTAQQFTIKDLNKLPGGPYAQTKYDVGPGAGPRPTQAPPPRDYTVGAIFRQDSQVSAVIELTPQTPDPGRVDVIYETEGLLRVDKSSAAPGELVRVSVAHDPAGGIGQALLAAYDHWANHRYTPEVSMRSRWPREDLHARFDIAVDAEVSVEYWSIDPQDGDQLHGIRTIINGTRRETGSLANLQFQSGDLLRLGILEGVDQAPEEVRDLEVVFQPSDWSVPDWVSDLGSRLLAPGYALPIPITLPPLGCGLPLVKNFKVCTKPISYEVMGIRFQIPELDTPVSDRFNGGSASAWASTTPVVPARNCIDEAGRLVSTVPNRFRPFSSVLGLDGDGSGWDKFTRSFLLDNANLSSDVVRLELDLDGILAPAAFGWQGDLYTPGGFSLLTYNLDLIDLDAVVFQGWDQTLVFDPGLVAHLAFNKDVRVRLPGSASFQTVRALTLGVSRYRDPAYPVTCDGASPAPVPALASEVEIEQPAGGFEVEVEYSFENNRFDNQTHQTTTVTGQIGLLKGSLGGLVGKVLEAALGFKGLAAARYTLSTPYFEGERRGGSDPLVPEQLRFPGSRVAILDPSGDGDGDGIADAREVLGCMDPQDSDSDDDGLADGTEDANRNGLMDSGETDPCQADSDRDGLADGYERGLLTPGPGTDQALFRPAPRPDLKSNPLASDSDGDGVADGEDAFVLDPAESRDGDGDGIGDNGDNCPSLANRDQADRDGDGTGDVCTPFCQECLPDRSGWRAILR